MASKRFTGVVTVYVYSNGYVVQPESALRAVAVADAIVVPGDQRSSVKLRDAINAAAVASAHGDPPIDGGDDDGA